MLDGSRGGFIPASATHESQKHCRSKYPIPTQTEPTVLVAALISIIGIVLGIVIVEKTGLRLGGVIVVPVLAVYSLYTFSALPLFLLSATIAYILVGLIRQRTLIYGRQLLIASLSVGALVPVLATITFDLWLTFESAAEIAFVGTILPGIAVYNYHKLDDDQKIKDIAISLGVLAGLILFGATIITPTLATRLDPGATSVLLTPGSDIAAIRGAVQGDIALTTHLARDAMLVLIGLGVAFSEAAQARWGIRMGGLIAIPLLVVFALAHSAVIPVYIGGIITAYVAITAINRLMLVYGRVLLSLSLVVSMLYATAVSVMIPVISGFLLYFSAILAGVGAYNFHRVSPPERLKSVAISVGLFASLLAGMRLVFNPTSAGVLTSATVTHAALFIVILAATAYSAYDLEQRRRTAADQHGRGVSF